MPRVEGTSLNGICRKNIIDGVGEGLSIVLRV